MRNVCNYKQETITLRLDVNHLKDRVSYQRAIMDRVLDDLRDVDGELKAMDTFLTCRNKPIFQRILVKFDGF